MHCWTKRGVGLLAMATIFFMGGEAVQSDDPPVTKRTTHEMMREKLSVAQNLLHSVVIEDYPATQKQAAELAQLTRDAAWQAYRTDQYRMESVEFERSAYLLSASAKQERLGDTTLGFLGVTLSCVRCHRYLRESTDIESQEITIPAIEELSDEQQMGSFWMKKKLELSEAILAGLAVGDSASIEKNAQVMQDLSKIEGWSRRKDAKEYRQLLEGFRQANQELISQSAKGDLDNAAIAFTQVTLSCIKCHQHLRSSAEAAAAKSKTPQE